MCCLLIYSYAFIKRIYDSCVFNYNYVILLHIMNTDEMHMQKECFYMKTKVICFETIQQVIHKCLLPNSL